MNGIHLAGGLNDQYLFMYCTHVARAFIFISSFSCDHLWLHHICNRKSLLEIPKRGRRIRRGKKTYKSTNGFLFACKIHVIGSDLTRNKINNRSFFFLPHSCFFFVCVCVYKFIDKTSTCRNSIFIILIIFLRIKQLNDQ